MRVIHLTPTLPPAVSGVGDYAFLLAKELRNSAGIDSLFVVCNPLWTGPSVLDGFNVHRLSVRSAATLFAVLHEVSCSAQKDNSEILLLQLSPYGYEGRGAPSWLHHALSHWKKRHEGARVLTMFHELFATSAPWHRAFWLSPLQRYAVRKIQELTDFGVTNIDRHAAYLSLRGSSAKVMPVMSNVGEQHGKSLFERQRRVVVFGARQTKKLVYRQLANYLPAIAKQYAIEEVLDIGETVEAIGLCGPPGIRTAGVLAPSKITDLLSESVFGFLEYPLDYLGKSGVFAAYCAHGVVPVLPRVNSVEASNGLLPGVHFLDYEQLRRGLTWQALEQIRINVLDWYQGHSLLQHSQLYQQLLERLRSRR